MASWRCASSGWPAKRLGDTPALRIGKPPKRLLVYRTREPFAGIRRAPLEVLCLGQQFVAYAEHPDTGQPYAWPDEGLADLDIESLPEIDADRAAAFLDEALALIPPEMRPKSLGAKGRTGPGTRVCRPMHRPARWPRSGARSPGCRTPSSTTTAGCASAWR
jgi:hypothetical protein